MRQWASRKMPWRRTRRPGNDPGQVNRPVARRAIIFLSAGLVLLILTEVLVLVLSRPTSPGDELRYDEFLTDLRANRIQSAVIRTVDSRITGTYDAGQYWVSYGQGMAGNPIFSRLLNSLEAARVPVAVDQQWGKSLLGPLTVLLPTLILVDALVLIFLLIRREGAGLMAFGRAGSRRVRSGEAKITFKDVAGVDEAIEELAEIRDYLSNPSRFLAMGARVPSGILLVGPPGCGKTLLARAVAGEAEVPFFSMSGSDFVEIFVGVGAARIRDLFRVAREAAPSIVFIDELDAVGRGRTAMAVGGQDEREATLNQLLVGLDGFESEPGVVVLAATNRPDVLDPALLRPGRFDRRIYIDLPDVAGRLGILKVHTRGKPLAADVNLETLARRTSGFSGADLASVVNEAALLAARRGKQEITQSILSEAVERVMAGPERRTKIIGPRDKELLAYHEAGHALVSAVANPTERVTKISIIARGRGGGFTWFVAEEEHHLTTRAQLQARLVTLMGGRAAELLVSGEPTSGAQDDLERATEMARRMVCELGMSQRIGPRSLKPAPSRVLAEGEAAMRFSEEMAKVVDEEIQTLLGNAIREATAILEKHRTVLDRLAGRLQEVESLEGGELDELLYPVGLRAVSS